MRTNTLQDNLFLFLSSVIAVHTYYPSGLFPTSVSAPAASVQDLVSFTPLEGYLIPVSDSLAALKCHSGLARVVFSRCSFTIALQGRIFLPLCSVTWCFKSEVFMGFLPAQSFQTGSEFSVPCFPASCQEMPFFLLKISTAAGKRGNRLSKLGMEKKKKVTGAASSLSIYFLYELKIRENKPNRVVLLPQG